MRHLLRHALRGSIIGLCGLAIAACSDLAFLSDAIDTTRPAYPAARAEITGINAVRMQVARKALEYDDYDVAARFYRTVHEALPGNIAPLLGLGEVELARGALDDAEAAYRAALLLSPDAAEANDGLGRVLVSKGAFFEAIQHFERALAKAPSAGLHNRLGVAHDLMGDGEGAQRHYRTALELDPNLITARNNLALSLAISEQYSEAIAQMERVAAMPGATDRHRQNLAFVYGMAGRLEDTERVLGRTDVPQSQQDRDRAVFERIRALAEAGDRSAILDFLRSAKPGDTFADQMENGLPPAPETAVAATAAQEPAPQPGLRPDEMVVPTPAAAMEPAGTVDTSSAIPAKPAATPKTEEHATGMARLSPPGSPIETPDDTATAIEGAAAATAAAGPYRIQLAAYRTEASAFRGRQILLEMLGARAAGLEVLVRQPRGEGGINYHLRTPPVADRETGRHLCTEIIAAGHIDCLVILHNSARWQAIAVPSAVAAEQGQYRVQLASYRSESRAIHGRAILSKLLDDRIDELDILVKRSHSAGSNSIDFTIRTAPLQDREAGDRLCAAVRQAGHADCLVILHNDAFWQLTAQGSSQRAAATSPATAAPLDAAAEPQPIVAEPQPAVAEPQSAVAEPQPAVAEPQAAVAEPQAAAEELLATAAVPPATATSAPDGPYRIQLASYRSESRAIRGLAILSKLLDDPDTPLEILVKRSHAEGSKAVDFTIRSAPLKDYAEGDRLCAAIIEAGHTDCLVIQHNDAVWQLAAHQPQAQQPTQERRIQQETGPNTPAQGAPPAP